MSTSSAAPRYRIGIDVGGTFTDLFLLDAQTGKELWNSGKQIDKWNHWSGLAVANGRIYINTFDGYLYCFGLKK